MSEEGHTRCGQGFAWLPCKAKTGWGESRTIWLDVYHKHSDGSKGASSDMHVFPLIVFAVGLLVAFPMLFLISMEMSR